MREIEIKARVANKQALLALLMEQGIDVGAPVTQHDRVFGMIGPNEDDGDNDLPWLRIRSEMQDEATKHIFTFKKSVTNQMDSIEHETEVFDDGELEKIITRLGFVPYSDLVKTRQKARLGDIEICIDTVDGLGDFIEVEKLTEDHVDYDVIAMELWSVLNDFSISRDDHVTDGYDILMNRMLAGE